MITLDLNEKQKAAFKKLKAAYDACKKAGILFVNNYGTLEAYDSFIVSDYSNDDTYDSADDDVISSHDSWCRNTFRIPNEWCDDEHLIKLTAKGKKQIDDSKD